ncbi:MAG: hypothetical protein HYX48_00900 [Chlamydiales bacterium]|nr:hypothetical protein [Chlamydiales bacterium]
MRRSFLAFTILPLVLLCGCASYEAAPLSSLSSQIIRTQAPEASSDLLITAKTLTKAECKQYFDRDVIKKGYQPVQLYIQNDSDKSFSFSPDRVGLTCARSEEVARKVHTSTLGRAAGYGAAALFLWPMAIPAVVDGIKSSQANEALDRDFSAKTAMDQTIQPHAHFNKVLFIPANEYKSTFDLVLIDLKSGDAKTFTVNAN